jgi:hypothetical protein
MRGIYRKLEPFLPSGIRRLKGVVTETFRYKEHKYAKRNFYRYVRRIMAGFIVEVDPGPALTKELYLTTSVMYKDEAPNVPNPDIFFLALTIKC